MGKFVTLDTTKKNRNFLHSHHCERVVALMFMPTRQSTVGEKGEEDLLW